jgi:hypothetical protein
MADTFLHSMRRTSSRSEYSSGGEAVEIAAVLLGILGRGVTSC